MAHTKYAELYEQGTGRFLGYEPWDPSPQAITREQNIAALSALLHDSPPAIGVPELYAAIKLLSALQGIPL